MLRGQKLNRYSGCFPWGAWFWLGGVWGICLNPEEQMGPPTHEDSEVVIPGLGRHETSG